MHESIVHLKPFTSVCSPSLNQRRLFVCNFSFEEAALLKDIQIHVQIN